MYFWHTGILTADIEKTIGAFCALPGVTREQWTVMELGFPQKDLRVGTGGRLKAAFARVGGCVYELLEPLDDTSYHAAQLKQKGPGQHHLAYVCPEDMDGAVASLLHAGGRVVWEFERGAEHACYVEMAGSGLICEFINNCPFMPE